MSEMNEKCQSNVLTPERLKELREIANGSTPVVGWYAHSREVRGPFGRWFAVSEVPSEYKKHVAAPEDDVRFAAAAMNSLAPLLDLVEQLQKVTTAPEAVVKTLKCPLHGKEGCACG